MGGVEVVEGLQVFLVGILHAGVGEEVDGHRCAACLREAADARTGDEVRLGGEPLVAEDVVAGAHHPLVVDVDVGDVNPCAHAVLAHVESHLLDAVEVFVENEHRLDVGVGAACLFLAEADAVQDEVVGLVGRLHQNADFTAVEGRLFDDGTCSGGEDGGMQRGTGQFVILVLCVAEKHFRELQVPPFCLFGIQVGTKGEVKFAQSVGEASSLFRCEDDVFVHFEVIVAICCKGTKYLSFSA